MTNEELTMAILESAKAIKKNIQPNLLLDYITNLQQKYEEADYDRHKLFEENAKLEKRIDKAVEYMKKNEFINIDNYWEIVKFYQDLLNILQKGSKKDE